MTTVSISVLGVEVTVDGDDEGIRRRLLEAYPACSTPITGPAAHRASHAIHVRERDGAFELQVDDRDHGAPIASRPLAFAQLVWEINQLVVRAPSPYLLVHAAAGGLDGRAVVMVGPSGAGKSTLVAALAARGWGYLTDEVAAIELDTATVVPYPKPIALDASACRLLGIGTDGDREGDRSVKVPIALGMLGGSVAPRSRVAALALVQVAASDRPAVRPLGKAAAMMGVSQQCFNLAEHTTRGFAALADIVRAAATVEVAAADPGATVELLRRVVEETDHA